MGEPVNQLSRSSIGDVRVDGSGIVAPIKSAAQTFTARDPRVRVTVGISGTGEVNALLGFFFDNVRTIVEYPRVNYVALDYHLRQMDRQRLEFRSVGFAMASAGKNVSDLKETFGK